MSAALDYRGLLLFMAGHLTDAELLDAEIELHLRNCDRAGAPGPRAQLLAEISPVDAARILEGMLGAEFERRAAAGACGTCNGRGHFPAPCPDCAKEATPDGHD